MTYPNIVACPRCGAAGDTLLVCTYDNGWRHVECDRCHYMGDGAGNILAAIRLHNAAAAKSPNPAQETADG